MSQPSDAPAPRRTTDSAGSPRIDYAVWELTLKCDLACRLCGSRGGTARSRELSTGEAHDVVLQLADLGVREVTLIGGEIYLRPDFDRIAGAIAARGILCSVVTGGFGFDAAVARRVREAGVRHVAVSIDGPASAHDGLRGVRGSFEAALGALRRVRDEGIPVSVNTQINRRCAPDLEALFEVLAPERILGWRVHLTVPMGRAAEHASLLLQPFELLDLFPRLARLKTRCIDRGIAFFPGDNVGYFGPYETLLRGDLAEAGHWTGCGAGKNVLGIEADGTVKACASLPTQAYAGGDVRRSIRDLLAEVRELRFTRDRSVADLWGFCRTCYYAEVCQAGCPWTSHALLGRPGNNPMCHYRALELCKRQCRERLVAVALPPGLPFDTARFDLVLEPLPKGGSSDAGGSARAVRAL